MNRRSSNRNRRTNRNPAFLLPLVPYIPWAVGGIATLWGVNKLSETVASTGENLQNSAQAFIPSILGGAVGYFGANYYGLSKPLTAAVALAGVGLGFYAPQLLKSKEQRLLEEKQAAEAKAEADYQANWRFYNPLTWFGDPVFNPLLQPVIERKISSGDIQRTVIAPRTASDLLPPNLTPAEKAGIPLWVWGLAGASAVSIAVFLVRKSKKQG